MLPIWKRLDALRKLNGLTQDQIAKKIGHTGNGLVQKVLNGKGNIPLNSLDKWLDAFGQMTDDLRLELRRQAILEYGDDWIKGVIKAAESVAVLLGTVRSTLLKEDDELSQECGSVIERLYQAIGRP